MSNALLAVLVLTPAVLTYLLKSNAALAFLAICGGFAAITLSGSDIEHLFGKTKITSLTSNDVGLILLLAPLFLTILFTVGSISSHKLRLFHLVPAVCAGGLLAIVAAPMFNQLLQTSYSNSQLWKNMQNAQTYVVGVGLLASLLLVWTSGITHAKHGKKHK